MVLLCSNSFTLTLHHSPLPSSSSSSSSSSSILAIARTPVSRVNLKPVGVPPKPLSGIRISTPFAVKRRRTGSVIVGAAADGVDGATPAEEGGGSQSALPPPESQKEAVPVDKLPLESKLKERQEQKLRMKLAKKIRLRRKRLVRKRRLRKKGCCTRPFCPITLGAWHSITKQF